MTADSAVRIAVLLPDLLGTYGDRGNAIVLAHRLLARGFDAEIHDVFAHRPVPTGCDIYLLGGEDAAGPQAIRVLANSAFPVVIARGATVLAICAGMQILGKITPAHGVGEDGLGLLDVATTPGPDRAVGETVARLDPGSGLVAEDDDAMLTGFENHRGRTVLGPDARPLAHTVTGVGNGDGTEGAVSGAIVGTYLHGPVLARNPLLADHLLTLVTGATLPPLHLDAVTELRRSSFRLARRERRRARPWSRLVPRGWSNLGITARQTDDFGALGEDW